MTKYLDFLKEKGKPLSEINPGSDEVALTARDALQALELLRESQTIILGGDIVSEENNKLIYAYQLWGEAYHCLNWSFDRSESESPEENLEKSYLLAKKNISSAYKTAEQLKRKCYIVLVIE